MSKKYSSVNRKKKDENSWAYIVMINTRLFAKTSIFIIRFYQLLFSDK